MWYFRIFEKFSMSYCLLLFIILLYQFDIENFNKKQAILINVYDCSIYYKFLQPF